MEEIQAIFSAVMTETIHSAFIARHLAKYGYTSINQFRKEGRNDLGDDFFNLCRELDKFDLGGLQFIVAGYDDGKISKIFEITGAGIITDRNLERYAVIGSGYWMASAAL